MGLACSRISRKARQVVLEVDGAQEIAVVHKAGKR